MGRRPRRIRFRAAVFALGAAAFGAVACSNKGSEGTLPRDAAEGPDAPSGREAGACGAACEWSCCGSECVNLTNDFKNCGTCGHECAGPNPYCDNGVCRPPPCSTTCSPGTTCCAGQCCAAGEICCNVPDNHGGTIGCTRPSDAGTCALGLNCKLCF